MTGKCRICGKEFKTNYKSQVTCLDPKCRAENKRKVDRDTWRRKRLEELEELKRLRDRKRKYNRLVKLLYPERFEPDYDKDGLRIDAMAAKEAGMSYGYYMALVKNGGVQHW